MIIGFFGKGGSGKSTLAAHFARFLAGSGFSVLAIDADHNMDLAHELRGSAEGMRYLGDSMSDLLSHEGGPYAGYASLVDAPVPPRFSLSPTDPFTARYAVPAGERMQVMAGGPHTDAVRYGESCSHVLTSALKAYLPLLSLAPGEAAVLDEKAGADGAGTGIATGITLAVIAAEPTVHGVKAAHQIADLLDFFGTPYRFVLNKAGLGGAPAPVLRDEPLAEIPFSRDVGSELVALEAFARIAALGRSIEAADPGARLWRSRQKFARNAGHRAHAAHSHA